MRLCASTGTGATGAIMPVCVVVYFSDIPRKYASPSSWPDNVCVRDIGSIPSATLAKDHQKWKMTLANALQARCLERLSTDRLDAHDEFNSPA